MKITKVLYIVVVLLIVVALVPNVSSQQTGLELPIQLFGFPVIIASVRLTNFLKKLKYSISPATYRSRNRRQLTFAPDAPELDVTEVEKYIVAEFGSRACVYERVCARMAARARSQPPAQFDWPDVFRQYKRSPEQTKDFYLLSVFLGDIVGSAPLCHQLGKRRSCGPMPGESET